MLKEGIKMNEERKNIRNKFYLIFKLVKMGFYEYGNIYNLEY